jgi:hypothetical protein
MLAASAAACVEPGTRSVRIAEPVALTIEAAPGPQPAIEVRTEGGEQLVFGCPRPPCTRVLQQGSYLVQIVKDNDSQDKSAPVDLRSPGARVRIRTGNGLVRDLGVVMAWTAPFVVAADGFYFLASCAGGESICTRSMVRNTGGIFVLGIALFAVGLPLYLSNRTTIEVRPAEATAAWRRGALFTF